MLGAIFGDIVGSSYEFNNTNDYNFKLLSRESRPTDDSCMTLAVARALMESYGQGDDAVRKALIWNMQDIGRRYPNAGYGGMFRKWLRDRKPEPYNSFGNGSAMRVAAAGWLYRTLEETLHAAKLTAEVTHNHPEGIKGAQAVAASIFLARAGATKEHITAYVMDTFGYDLSRTLDEIRPGYGFFAICQKSCPEAIIAFLEGTGFEDVIRKAVSLGGNSDTIACMAGAIAEAYYGMPEKFKEEALSRLDAPMRDIVHEFRRFYREHSGKPFDGWQSVFEGPESTEKQEDSVAAVLRRSEEVRKYRYKLGPEEDYACPDNVPEGFAEAMRDFIHHKFSEQVERVWFTGLEDPEEGRSWLFAVQTDEEDATEIFDSIEAMCRQMKVDESIACMTCEERPWPEAELIYERKAW